MLYSYIVTKGILNLVVKVSFLVMQDKLHLEFWDLGQVFEYVSICFLICEMALIIPDF